VDSTFILPSALVIGRIPKKSVVLAIIIEKYSIPVNPRPHGAKAHSRQAKANRTTPTSRIPPLRGVRGVFVRGRNTTPPNPPQGGNLSR